MSMSGNAQDIPVAVVGVGRMGRHHARTYRKLAGAKLVAVVDANAERAATVADEFGCDACTDTEDLLKRHPEVRAATISVPTAWHLNAARPLLERRIACLVEKPIAPTTEEAQELIDAARRAGAALQIGHTERFNPAIRAVIDMNIHARFMEVHRVSPMTFRSLDIGVVMDMMIHDLDIVLTLARSPLARVDAAGVSVLGKHEDVANARLVFANGGVANLTASRVALKTERKMRIFSEDAYVSLDYQRRTGIVIRKAHNADALHRVREQLEAGMDLTETDYSSLVNVEELVMDRGDAGDAQSLSDPLTAELTSFIDAVRLGGKPIVDGEAGLAAVEAAERVIHSLREHRWEGVAESRVRID